MLSAPPRWCKHASASGQHTRDNMWSTGDLQTGRGAAGACLQLGRKKVELNAVVAHVQGNFPAGLVTARDTRHTSIKAPTISVKSKPPCMSGIRLFARHSRSASCIKLSIAIRLPRWHSKFWRRANCVLLKEWHCRPIYFFEGWIM